MLRFCSCISAIFLKNVSLIFWFSHLRVEVSVCMLNRDAGVVLNQVRLASNNGFLKISFQFFDSLGQNILKQVFKVPELSLSRLNWTNLRLTLTPLVKSIVSTISLSATSHITLVLLIVFKYIEYIRGVIFGMEIGSYWLQTGQIWVFLRLVSVHFGSANLTFMLPIPSPDVMPNLLSSTLYFTMILFYVWYS